MKKKAYTGVEISVNIYDTEEIIVASGTGTTTKPEFDGTQDPDDLPIL